MDPVKKFRLALTALVDNDEAASFYDIIESERDAFRGLHVTYATNATELEIHGIPLDRIREQCSLITSPFGSKGVLFYSDVVYSANVTGRRVRMPVDYSVALDKNMCENVRLLSCGGTLRAPDDFRALLQLLRGRGDESLNFDYLAYIAEEHPHFYVPNNKRPLETLRALKRLDYIVPECLYEHPFSARFDVDESTLDAAVNAAFRNVVDGDTMRYTLVERAASYAMLLQAVLLSWDKTLDLEEKLNRLVQFSLGTIGKLCKMEIYLSWKLFGGAGKVPAFFNKISQPTSKSMKVIGGMAWDVSMLRVGEKMAALRRNARGMKAEFFIPLIASLDESFKLLVEACPIRAVVADFENGYINTVFDDELKFQLQLQKARSRIESQIGSFAEQETRAQASFDPDRVNQGICQLEKEVRAKCLT